MNFPGPTLPSMTALQAFERTATLGSLANAARELGRTPSAVSHSIKGLEQRLGICLFERSGRSVMLTASGQRYLAAVRPALRDLSVATAALLDTQNAKLVRVSALAFFTSTVLLPELGTFQAKHPDIDLRIETSNHFANVQQGEVDIGIRFASPVDKTLIAEKLIKIQAVPVASQAYLEANGHIRKPSDLLSHTLIHVAQQPEAWSSWYLAVTEGQALRNADNLVMDSVAGALDAVKAGLGVGLAMRPLILKHPDYGTAFVPQLEHYEGPCEYYYGVYTKASQGRRNVVLTLEWLRSACKALSALN